jgi:hypothetical protein
MAFMNQPSFDWRKKAKRVSGQLKRARSTVEALGDALAEGDDGSTRSVARTAHEAVGSVARSVKTLQVEQPAEEQMGVMVASQSWCKRLGAKGSMSILRGGCNAVLCHLLDLILVMQ